MEKRTRDHISDYLIKEHTGKWLINYDTYESIEWVSDYTPPSKTDVETAVGVIKSAWDAQEYARNRASAYPSIGDQLDMIYKDTKNSTTTHADAVEVVKTKWPKDNSGPV